MPVGQVDMLLTIPGEAPPPPEDIIGQVNMMLTIPAPPEDIVGQVDMRLTIPREEPPPDEEPPVIPLEWQEWLEGNWEVIGTVIIAVVILAIILTRRT